MLDISLFKHLKKFLNLDALPSDQHLSQVWLLNLNVRNSRNMLNGKENYIKQLVLYLLRS